MAEKLGLRARFALFFAALALGGTVAIAAGLWWGHSRSGGAAPIDSYIIAGVAAVAGLIGLTVWVAFLFDENVAKPILGLASDLHTRAQADVSIEIDQAQGRYLGALAPAANAIHHALAETRAAQERLIAEETARLNSEKALFAVLLRDLAEGVVVATPDLRVMLYNREAHGLLGNLGLGRPVKAFLRPEPLLHALDRLEAQLARGVEEAEKFLTASADGSRMLLARVSPVISEGERKGYVLMFHDATEDLESHAERDHLFNTLLERVRRRTAALNMVLDVVDAEPDMAAEARGVFRTAMMDEVAEMTDTLSEMSARHEEALARHWPMSSVASSDIFDALKARHDRVFTIEGDEQFLKCDGFAVLEMMDMIVRGLRSEDGREGFTLRAEPQGKEVWLILEWAGAEASDGMIDRWLRAPLSEGYGQYSGRDALEGHRTEIWPERGSDSNSHRIVLPLHSAQVRELTPVDARPEFYDFNLSQVEIDSDWADQKLSEMSFVVFDTETTGLTPRQGDEIVQIAGVRIVNGRMLKGEEFDTLVDPKRNIPAASTAVHHISNDMIKGAPDIATAGREFHDFCHGSVLVAHNAPFDMTFLNLKEEVIGRKFDQPVLCTVLLSALLFDHSSQHTLDALAERFGVVIPPELRHTAMGDTRATAEVFLQLIRLLEADGITTLGEAINAANRMAQIRKMQNY
ncbi:exonuclease domain-containing protein [Actibacterium sp. XHP0104]|uniref:3'-5' exonuclease n=1 Tax=Actibacterium sp. XHP0104 TaxID=2984335 RepID=UPI0021E982E9|nr:exonuclease domain-containing protein [Actibacterium sp. XHP0104]MCV2880574.1 exonuclease domain-containing protein [Actibacterium sp. XHP0104]